MVTFVQFFKTLKQFCGSLYLRCPTLIQKQKSENIPFFAVGAIFFIANVSDFTRILLVKIKNFELSYFHEKLSYASTF
jgi:hypothetical protein